MLMSSSTSSGGWVVALSSADRPSCAVETSWPKSRISSASASAASRLSSTMRMRRWIPTSWHSPTPDRRAVRDEATVAFTPGLAAIRAVVLEVAPTRRDEDRDVRVQCVPVGHPGDVISDRALRPVLLRDPLVLGRQQVRVLLEMAEQIPQDALGLAVFGLGRTR